MDAGPEGFVVGNRCIKAAEYSCAGGWTVIVWFDAAGRDFYGNTRHAEKGRAVITAKPGDKLLRKEGTFVVERVESYREHAVSQLGG